MMRMPKTWVLAVCLSGLAAGQASAGVVTVTSFANSYTPNAWFESDVRPGGTASIVDAPPGGPLPNGAAMLTTDSTNAAKAEVSIGNDYGLVKDILDGLNISYSYYKTSGTGGNAESAPSIKLTFQNLAGTPGADDYMTLVYEPYWQLGSSHPVTTDTWLNSGTIDKTTGLFWSNGGFGTGNSGGGPPLMTLGDWFNTLNSDFPGASLIGVSVGMGSYQPGQIGYFDDVMINGTKVADTTYDFQSVPEPASLISVSIAGLVGLGFAWRRRKAAGTVA